MVRQQTLQRSRFRVIVIGAILTLVALLFYANIATGTAVPNHQVVRQTTVSVR